MSEKKLHPAIICRCLDRTQEDMIGAFHMMIDFLGIDGADINAFRRFSWGTTGFCQGRGCLALMQRIYVNEMRKLDVRISPDELKYKARSPAQPVPLGIFAKNNLEEV